MKMKRRSLIAAAGATALLPGVPARAQGGGEVIIATTGGLMTNSLQAHFYKRFEAETGIKVRAVAIELPDQWARAVAGARTGTVPSRS
jgi:spermidine/putrescine-binding protein